MALKWDSGDDVSTGSTFLSEPGLYHMVVTKVNEHPTNKDGKIMDWCLFSVTCSVVTGNVDGQRDKDLNLTFAAPSISSKDEGKFARKKIDRFFIATALMQRHQAGQSGLSIDLESAVGRQFLVNLVKRQDSQFLDVNFSDIFHVDDPEARSYPRDEDALKLIRPEHRWTSSDSGKPPAHTSHATVDDI